MNLINIKTAIRNLVKNKLLAFLNIVGLGTGLAVAILIFNYSYQEYSADKHHKNLKDIYVLQNDNSAHVSYEMASLIKDRIPGIKYVSMVESNFKNEFVLNNKNQISFKTEVVFVDENFMKIFSFDLVSGNLENALSAPQSIVLTESESQRLFGNENPVGQMLTLKGNNPFLGESEVEVKAVIKDMPANSNLQFQSLSSFTTAKNMMPWMDQCGWNCSNAQNYIFLEEAQNPDYLSTIMTEKLRPLIPEKVKCDFSLMGYNKVYFSSIRDDFKHGNLKLIYTLISIAVLILIIATINYVNLSLAGSSKRMTEVGVRKIAGVKPFQLINQFLSESILLSIIAMLIGLLLARLVTPLINSLSIIYLPEIPLFSVSYWMVLLGGAILIGFIAGILPAFSFNNFKPISLITGRLKSKNKGINLKRALIVFQFAISIILIICTLTVTRQLSLVRNADMGFETENIINVRLSPEVKKDVFKDLLNKIPGVEDVSFARWYPGNIGENWGHTLVYNGVETKVNFACENADANYIGLMGLKIIQGRNFSDSLQSDIGSAIINEAAVKEFGLENPLDAVFQKNKTQKIIGVVKDFNFQSLHNQIKPLVIFYEKEQVFGANIKLAAGNFESISQTLKNIESCWHEVSPGFPFDFKFIDEQVQNLYKTEMIFGKIFRYGSAFAIFISCLGLFGLVLGSTEQRRKEIGIRKVNGAKVSEVLAMLNRDFVKWVLIAFLFATPVAYYVMNKWLENFAYKTSLSWWIFALAGILALGIALLTVSWQSWRAATRNPVESLRYE